MSEILMGFKKRGLTIFLTGLSAAGKTSIAEALCEEITKTTNRYVTVLDGDAIRNNLSSGLGFSKKDRDTNVLRAGFVATEITKHGGIVICAMISPYNKSREAVREMVTRYGDFIEIYVSTPLQVCEQRDPKGLYAKARQGVIKNFTGIDDPYEAPKNPEIQINTSVLNINETINMIMNFLINNNYI